MLRLILFCTFITLSLQSYSQGFGAGIIAGISTTQVSGDNISGFNKAGLIIGGLSNLQVGEKTFFQAEIIYIQKGSIRNARPDKGEFATYKMAINYIEVPVSFFYRYNDKLDLEAGVSYGSLIFNREEDENGLLPETRSFKNYELAAHAGLSYPLTKGLRLHWRYSNSVAPIRPHLSGETNRLNFGQYNSVLAFTLRYTFAKAEPN